MEYLWSKDPKGQFVDGHKWDDVVMYHQEVFLPAWEKLEPTLCQWEMQPLTIFCMGPRHVAPLSGNHNESMYYANSWHKIQQVHQGESVRPYAKGEGVLLMVTDFVSADYRWLQSHNRSQQAQVLFKAGKSRDGYFTNEDILQQATNAMDILQRTISQKIMFLSLIM